MRAPQPNVLIYVAMGALPLLLFILLLSSLFGAQAYAIPILSLIALDLVVFGLLGFMEVFAGPASRESIRYEKHLENVEPTQGYVEVAVDRFDASTKTMKAASYKVPADRFTTVLDALIEVKHTKDASLAVRYSCRMGICGSCGVVINGKPALACESGALACSKNGRITVGPMKAHPMLKDLVTDFREFFGKHSSVEPVLYRKDKKEQLSAKSVYDQKPDQISEFLPYSYCIMCGLCNDACPVVNTNAEFTGPQALAQTYRYLKDNRDQKGVERIKAVDRLSGLWGCEYAGACSAVCPKGVDPATAIQLLKAETAKSYLNSDKE